MRIIFDHQIFCLQQYGGISRYFHELANHIARSAEGDAKIFAPFYLNEYFTVNGGAHPCGIKVPRLFGMGRLVAWGIDTGLAYFNLRRRCDVDIFHETYYSMVDCCPTSAKRVVTVHDMIYEKFRDQFPRREKIRKMKAYAVSRADHVICVSENTRYDLITILGVPEKKTSVVYHGYSFRPKQEIRPAILKKPYLLFVGQRGGYKNFEILLRAYAHSRKLRGELLLVCFGGGAFSIEEQASMDALGVSEQQVVQFSGNDNVLERLYKFATAFVYPSLYEGFGIPLLEAMSLECPVLCSNTGSFTEVVGTAAELFDPGDVGALQRAIEMVVFESAYRNSLIQRGQVRAKQFSWDKCAKDTMQVYERLLS